MPTIIDSLVVTLGLDGTQFKKSADAVNKEIDRSKANAGKAAGEMESHGKQAAEFFNQAKRAALGLAAVLGFKTMENFARQSVNASAEVGRLARNLQMSVKDLSEWEAVGEQFGGTTKAAVGDAFAHLSDEIEKFNLTGETSMIPLLRQIGVEFTDAHGKARPLVDIMKDINKAAQGRDPREVSFIMNSLGMGALTNTIAQSPDKLNSELGEARRQGTVSDKDVEAATRLQTATMGATNAFEALFRTLLTNVEPVLTPFFDDLKEIAVTLSHNKDITDAANETIKLMGDELRSVDWKAFADGIHEAADWLKYLSSGLDPVSGKLNTASDAVGEAGSWTYEHITKPLLEKLGYHPGNVADPGNVLQDRQTKMIIANATATTVSGDLPAGARAFLDAVSKDESAGRYNVRYNGKTDAEFSDYSQHPNVMIPIPSKPGEFSSAAGRYQITKSTWDGLTARHKDLTDFSPANQDKAAWYLAQEHYKGNLESDLETADPAKIREIAAQLKSQWTSLPGGEEQGKNANDFVDRVIAAVLASRGLPSGSQATAGTTPPSGAPQASTLPSANNGDLAALMAKYGVTPTPGAGQGGPTTIINNTVGDIRVNTAATDGPGTAAAIRAEMSRRGDMSAHVNVGLQ